MNAMRAMRRLGAALGLLILTGQAQAYLYNYSFTGTFRKDNDVQFFDFTTDGNYYVRLRTFGWAGGQQADLNVVQPGSFDPYLALFDGAGQLVAKNDGGSSTSHGACGPDIVGIWDGMENDACIDLWLDAGRYTVALAKWPNWVAGTDLVAGFEQDKNPDYVCWPAHCHENNNWAIDLLSVENVVRHEMPEPVPLALLGIAALGVAAARRRKA